MMPKKASGWMMRREMASVRTQMGGSGRRRWRPMIGVVMKKRKGEERVGGEVGWEADLFHPFYRNLSRTAVAGVHHGEGNVDNEGKKTVCTNQQTNKRTKKKEEK